MSQTGNDRSRVEGDVRRAAWLLGLAVSSCSSQPSNDPPSEASPVAAAAPAVVGRAIHGVPHGGAIVLATVTERGDAALTIDELGEGRWWPQLTDQASAPPIPVRVSPSTIEAAIAPSHDFAGDGYVVALRDAAGDLELVHLTATGAELSRVQLPDGGRYEQVLIAGDAVLARRSDQTIARFDLAGFPRGVLAAPAGEQIATLAERAGLTVAVTGDPADGMRTLRELASTGPELAWGTVTKLPSACAGKLALSPDHQRVAVLRESGTIDIVQRSGPTPIVIGSLPDPAQIAPAFGFVDDDHLGVARNTVEWWTPDTKLRGDPWTAEVASLAGLQPQTAVGVTSGQLVLGQHAALVLVKPNVAARWIGYRAIADARIAIDGAGHYVVGQATGQVLWLDAQLDAVRAWDVPTALDGVVSVTAVDGSHVVIARIVDGRGHVDLYDVDHEDHPVRIADFAPDARVVVDPQHAIVLIADAGHAERYQLDVAAMRATALSPIALHVAAGAQLFATDPARAAGVAVIESGVGPDGSDFVVGYLASGAPAPASGRTGTSTRPVLVAADGTYVGTSGDAALLHGRVTDRDEDVLRLPPHISSSSLNGVSHDGQTILLFSDRQTIAIDRRGLVRWRVATIEPGQIAFSADDREVAIATSAGVATYDAVTGARRATGCAWRFDASDKPMVPPMMNTVPVCAE